MGAEAISDYALTQSHHASRVSVMPDDVYTGDITDATEIQGFQRAPTATVTALDPTKIHKPFLV